MGLDTLVIDPLSAFLKMDRLDAVNCLHKYYENCNDKNAVIVGKGESPSAVLQITVWEINDFIMAQFKKFIDREIIPLLTKWYMRNQAIPGRLILTGEGACIPGITEIFQDALNVKTEVLKWSFSYLNHRIPPTAYGMAQMITRDAGVERLQLNQAPLKKPFPESTVLNFSKDTVFY
jgi:hypothetical protein